MKCSDTRYHSPQKCVNTIKIQFNIIFPCNAKLLSTRYFFLQILRDNLAQLKKKNVLATGASMCEEKLGVGNLFEALS